MRWYDLSAIVLTALACGACGSGTLGGPGNNTSAVTATGVGGASGTGGSGDAAAACDAARTTLDTCVTNAEAACPDAVTALNTCFDVNRPDDGDGDTDAHPPIPPPGIELPINFPCKSEIETVRTCIAGCDADMQAVHDACAGLYGGNCPGMGNHPDGKGGGYGPHDGRGRHHR